MLGQIMAALNQILLQLGGSTCVVELEGEVLLVQHLYQLRFSDSL